MMSDPKKPTDYPAQNKPADYPLTNKPHVDPIRHVEHVKHTQPTEHGTAPADPTSRPVPPPAPVNTRPVSKDPAHPTLAELKEQAEWDQIHQRAENR